MTDHDVVEPSSGRFRTSTGQSSHPHFGEFAEAIGERRVFEERDAPAPWKEWGADLEEFSRESYTPSSPKHSATSPGWNSIPRSDRSTGQRWS